MEWNKCDFQKKTRLSLEKIQKIPGSYVEILNISSIDVFQDLLKKVSLKSFRGFVLELGFLGNLHSSDFSFFEIIEIIE